MRARATTVSPERSKGALASDSSAPITLSSASSSRCSSECNSVKTRRITAWDQIGRVLSSERSGFPEDLLHSSESVHAVERALGVHLDLTVGLGTGRDGSIPRGPGDLLRFLLRYLRRPGGPPDQDPDRSGTGSRFALRHHH